MTGRNWYYDNGSKYCCDHEPVCRCWRCSILGQRERDAVLKNRHRPVVSNTLQHTVPPIIICDPNQPARPIMSSTHVSTNPTPVRRTAYLTQSAEIDILRAVKKSNRKASIISVSIWLSICLILVYIAYLIYMRAQGHSIVIPLVGKF